MVEHEGEEQAECEGEEHGGKREDEGLDRDPEQWAAQLSVGEGFGEILEADVDFPPRAKFLPIRRGELTLPIVNVDRTRASDKGVSLLVVGEIRFVQVGTAGVIREQGAVRGSEVSGTAIAVMACWLASTWWSVSVSKPESPLAVPVPSSFGFYASVSGAVQDPTLTVPSGSVTRRYSSPPFSKHDENEPECKCVEQAEQHDLGDRAKHSAAAAEASNRSQMARVSRAAGPVSVRVSVSVSVRVVVSVSVSVRQRLLR